jgi:hypothetical protein
MAGRVDEAVGYCETGQIVFDSSRDVLLYGAEVLFGNAYIFIGQPERWMELLARHRDTTVHNRACLISRWHTSVAVRKR